MGFVCLAMHLLILPYAIPRLNSLLGAPFSASIANFLFYIASFLCVLILLFSFLRREFSGQSGKVGRILCIAASAFLILQISNRLMSVLIGLILPEFSNVNDRSIAGLLEENYALIAFATVFLVPVTEEALYRGVVFGSLLPYGAVLAYAACAAVFSAIHVVGYLGLFPAPTLIACFVQYLPAGLTLAWAYRKSETLITPILVHMATNTMGLIQLR